MAQKMARNPLVRRMLTAAALGCILFAGACAPGTPITVTEEIAPPVPDDVHAPSPAPSFTLDQPITFERISLEQGLSQSSVHSILQDSQGFMWFGTRDGLNKYDGYTFTHYRHVPGDPNSLSHNDVRAIIEDQQGTLWIGTDGGGLNAFDRDTGQFVHYRAGQGSDNADDLSGDFVRAILQDRDGVVWIGTEGGLSQFDLSTSQFTHYTHDPDDPASLGHNDVRAMVEDEQGALWIGTDGGGLDRFERVSGRFIHYRHNLSDPCSLGDNAVRAIFQDRDGTLWIGTEDRGLDKFDPSTMCFVPLWVLT
ncbi:MAG: hypothetical protein GY832_37540 [Chloroflexi bacterium]|nr:hypothetical protein [Chloroflexota bacterium]